MAAKKATASKFVVRAVAQGEWSQGDCKKGEFRAHINTDLAEVSIHVGPDYLEDWNPVPLQSYSMRYLRGGSHLRIAFELQPLAWKGELEVNVFGGFLGKFECPDGAGKVTGVGTVEEARDHVNEIPRPTQALAQKLQKEPTHVRWEAPACILDRNVMLIGIGGASKSGKSVLAADIASRLRDGGREAAVVEMSRYERCVGQYTCSAGVHESMFEDPSAINWPDLVKAITKTAESLAGSASEGRSNVVIVEGCLVFWMPEVRQALHHRLFLRASRQEILRRRQASATLAEPFVEHVFWPMFLQYGQPEAPWAEIQIDNDISGYPVSDALLDEAMGVLGFGSSQQAQSDAVCHSIAQGQECELPGASPSSETSHTP